MTGLLLLINIFLRVIIFYFTLALYLFFLRKKHIMVFLKPKQKSQQLSKSLFIEAYIVFWLFWGQLGDTLALMGLSRAKIQFTAMKNLAAFSRYQATIFTTHYTNIHKPGKVFPSTWLFWGQMSAVSVLDCSSLGNYKERTLFHGMCCFPGSHAASGSSPEPQRISLSPSEDREQNHYLGGWDSVHISG